MEINALFDNLTNPALLFFILGIISVQFKSDLKIPANSAKFISIYLLLSIGFKGGQELSHSGVNLEIGQSMMLGIFMALLIPIIAFFILRKKLGLQDAVAVAASYGSVSTVTFITAISFLDLEKVTYGGHMIAVMAIMEAPAIIVAALLIKYFSEETQTKSVKSSLIHALTNGSVMLILGSLMIGYIASEKQAKGIEPFTTDIFKGFLAVFLLDMGITCGKQLSSLSTKGITPFIFSAIMPFFSGLLALSLSFLVTDDMGNQLLFAILGASASYIAVPAAMKTIAPQANPSLFLSMALGITFPINVMIGIPFYYFVIEILAHNAG
jgi:uncharacterized protein